MDGRREQHTDNSRKRHQEERHIEDVKSACTFEASGATNHQPLPVREESYKAQPQVWVVSVWALSHRIEACTLGSRIALDKHRAIVEELSCVRKNTTHRKREE